MNGIPLGSLHELLLIAAFIVLFVALPENSSTTKIDGGKRYALLACAITLCIGIKIAATLFSPAHGVISEYQAPETTEYGAPTAFLTTKIDQEINFNNAGYSLHADPFPLWFLNEKDRFNGNGKEIDKTAIPFIALWKTNLRVPPTYDSITVSANQDAKITVILDRVITPIGNLPAAIHLPSRSSGTIPLEIRYDAGAKTNRFIYLAWTEGEETAITERFFYTHPATEKRLAEDRIWGIVNESGIMLIFLLLIAYLIMKTRGAAWREWIRSDRFIFSVLFLAGLAFSTYNLLAMAESRYFNLLPTGNDPVLYETFARHIAATGDWAMTTYEKDSYYWQILYYYLLAIAHLILGEALFPIFFIQSIALIGTALITIKIGQIITGTRNPFLYMAGIGVFFHPLMRNYSTQLYPAGALLAAITVLALFSAEKQPVNSKKYALFGVGGVLTGLLVLMRSNMEFFVPVILLWMAVSLKRKSLLPAVIFMISYSLMLAPFVIRNIAVGGKAELFLRSSGTSSLMIGTPVPEAFVPQQPLPPLVEKIAYRFVDGRATRTFQWMQEEPRAYGRLLISKAEVFFGINPVEIAISIPFIAFLFASVLFLMMPRSIAPAVKRKDYILTGGLVLTQAATLTIVSVGFTRYLVPLLPFVLLMLIFFALGIYNVMRAAFQRLIEHR